MLRRKSNLAFYQVFCMLFVSRLLVSLTYIPSLNSGETDANLLLSILLQFPLTLLSALPFYFLLRRTDGNILDAAGRVNLKLMNVIAVGMGLWFLLTAAINLARFEFFVTSEMTPQASSLFFALLIVVSALYAAYHGLETVGRVGTVLFALMLLGFGFIVVTMFNKMDITNFVPFLNQSAGKQLFTAAGLSANTVELAILALYRNRMDGKAEKLFPWWLAAVIATAFVLYTIAVGATGYYVKTQTFPIYALAVLAQAGVLERLDALHTSFWIMGVFMKVSLLLVCAQTCFGAVLPKVKKGVLLPLYGAGVIGVSLLIGQNLLTYTAAANFLLWAVPFGLFVIAVPLLLLVLRRRKGGNRA